jgi:hypothetical protein
MDSTPQLILRAMGRPKSVWPWATMARTHTSQRAGAKNWSHAAAAKAATLGARIFVRQWIPSSRSHPSWRASTAP